MSGHRNFKELVAKMSPERRARVKAEADELHREYVLSQIRQQVGFTQADVAERLGVSQPTYAECERGSNMRAHYRRSSRRLVENCRCMFSLETATTICRCHAIRKSNRSYK